ncbi:MAG: sulfatase-like hydrolase/transferase [Chthoniobacter sp.]|nr:sulfatase-like hydrolase/transferase [Chthoniobacter sp.]
MSSIRRALLGIAVCLLPLAPSGAAGRMPAGQAQGEPTGAPGADTKRPPNVVIFLTDDQGTLDVNCYGSKDLYTPAMDELAKTGVRFTQAYAHAVCCPARAMLLTGRYPQRGAVNSWTQGDAKAGRQRNMFLEEVTLAEVLKGAGYKTGMFGKWHLGAHPDFGPTKQGFDEFFGLLGGFIDNYNHHFLHGAGNHDLYDGIKEVWAPGEYFPDLMTARALEFVDRNKDVPFFLYVPFNIPHYPEQADAKFDERYRDMKMPRQAYAKMISTTDDRMGQIMARLEKHGLRDRTIILFLSDNGHSVEDYRISVDNHQSGLAKGTNYGANGGGGNTGKWIGQKGNDFREGAIRVPAIISWPVKLPAGAVREQAVAGEDWFPTLLELCGVPPPAVKLDGRSLVPIIRSADAPSHHQVMHWQWQWFWAVREGDWKLIGREGKATHLGNLADPEPEKKNHLSEQPELAQRLQAVHDAWLKEVEREYYESHPNSQRMY